MSQVTVGRVVNAKSNFALHKKERLFQKHDSEHPCGAPIKVFHWIYVFLKLLMSIDSMVSPLADQLPPAVLLRIFSEFRHPCHVFPLRCNRETCRTTSVLALGSICKEWRALAWKTPWLWDIIYILASPTRYDIQLELLQEWMARSQDLPLDIIYRAWKHPSDRTLIMGKDYIENAMFKLLVIHSMRWKSIDTQYSDALMIILNDGTVQGRIPILDSAVIGTTAIGCWTTSAQIKSLDFLSDAPNLKSLRCVIPQIRLSTTSRTFFWPRLVSLSVSGVSSKDFVEVLAQTPNIETCYVSTSRMYTTPSRSNAPTAVAVSENSVHRVMLPSLRLLSMKSCEDFQFLPFIAAPKLTSLMVNIGHVGAKPVNAILDFLKISRFQLHLFALATTEPLEAESLFQVLLRSESLTHLYIYSKKASDYQTLMRRIPKFLHPFAKMDIAMPENQDSALLDTRFIPGPVRLPNLQVLHFCTVDPVRSQEMIDMIKCRWHGVDNVGSTAAQSTANSELPLAQLKTVRFNMKPGPKPLLDTLEQEIAQGLQIRYDLSEKEPWVK